MGSRPKPPPTGRRWPWLDALGPGLITGAADDDPSGVGTYSIAGAQAGLSVLWLAWATWPLMAAVQMMCARIGMVTGGGLASALRRKFPAWLVAVAASALFLANTLNIGADLTAMADAAQTLSGVSRHLWVFVFAGGIAWASVRIRYRHLASALKWLALSLCAYALAAVLAHPRWDHVLREAVRPQRIAGVGGAATALAILGTTISPYLFFWQSAQEVEENRAPAPRQKVPIPPSRWSRIALRRVDIVAGTLASNLVMFFIMLTCAETLHRAGRFNIATTADAAAALAPLAGKGATWLYTAGLVGVGLLAIPTLAGSAAYAFAELLSWRSSLDAKPARALPFYSVMVGAIAVGVGVDFAGVNPVRALFWSAIVNGLLAPFLLCGILVVAADRRIMGARRSSRLSFGLVGIAALAMTAAAVGMLRQ